MRQVIQDLVAPDLKAHTVKLEALQKLVEIQRDATIKTLDAFRAEMRPEFAASLHGPDSFGYALECRNSSSAPIS